MKRKYINKGEEYIQAFPRFKKWINECICCHQKGYDPQMPEQISVVEGSLGSYFSNALKCLIPMENIKIKQAPDGLIAKHNAKVDTLAMEQSSKDI